MKISKCLIVFILFSLTFLGYNKNIYSQILEKNKFAITGVLTEEKVDEEWFYYSVGGFVLDDFGKVDRNLLGSLVEVSGYISEPEYFHRVEEIKLLEGYAGSSVKPKLTMSGIYFSNSGDTINGILIECFDDEKRIRFNNQRVTITGDYSIVLGEDEDKQSLSNCESMKIVEEE